MRKSTLALTALIFFVPASLWAQAGRVMLVLDGSNSMWGRIDGVEKIVVARDVLSQMIADFPPGMEVGLAAYGHRRAEACDDIEILLAPGNYSREVLEAAIRGVQPRGKTPITNALQLVADGLEDNTEMTHLVLVSDGRETCEGDPCDLVRTLREQGIQLTVHVVGLDVGIEESDQLQCIADAGGGVYAAAGTAGELTAALSDIRETVVEEVEESKTAAASAPPEGSKPGILIHPFWQLETGEKAYEGRISFANQSNGRLRIQLVNLNAINFIMVLPAQGEGPRPVENSFFIFGRGAVCRQVYSEPPFQATIESYDGSTLTGSFAGTLACPDYSALEVQGSFRIPFSGESP